MGTRLELSEAIRRDHRREDPPIRALAERHGVHRRTVRAALASAVPRAHQTPVRTAPKTFIDPPLCAAMVARLSFGGNIIETGTTRYRLAHARAQRSATTQPRSESVTLGCQRG